MLGAPSIWVIVALALGLAGSWGGWSLKNKWDIAASYKQGVSDGKASAAVEVVAAAKEIAAADREAEAATPLPADKAAIMELCKRRASCRERSAIK